MADSDASPTKGRGESGKADAVKVFLRIRPLNSRERAELKAKPGAVGVHDRRAEVTDPGTKQLKTFEFDGIFQEDVTQEHVYDTAARRLVDTVVDGFNATVLVYGQTGSGKTFTIMGAGEPPATVVAPTKPKKGKGGGGGAAAAHDTAAPAAEYKPGIIPQLCHDLFQRFGDGGQLTVELSCIELYNDKMTDLLCTTAKQGQAKIRQHPLHGVFIEGLERRVVPDAQAALKLIYDCQSYRVTKATAMNANSSRSHLIVTLEVKFQAETSVSKGKLHLVDLAGSERFAKTGGEFVDEQNSINKSLSTLQRVIFALTKRERPPFRESKLTWILSDSLGGNARTTIIATVSPSESELQETVSTLEYAARARTIVNHIKPNMNRNARMEELEKELQELRDRLRLAGSGGAGNEEERDALAREVMLKHAQIEELEERSRQEQLERSLREKQTELEFAQERSKREKLQQELDQLRRDHEQHEQKLALHAAVINRIGELEEELARKEEELERLRGELEQRDAELRRRDEEGATQAAAATQRVAELEGELKALRGMQQHFSQRREEMDTERKELEERNDDLQTELAMSQAQVTSLQETVAQLRAGAQEALHLRFAIEDLQRELEDRSAGAGEQEQKWAAERQRLEEEKAQLRRAMDERRADVEREQSELVRVQNLLKASDEAKVELQHQIETLRRQADDMTKVTYTNEEMRRQLGALQEERNEQMKQLADMQAASAHLEAERAVTTFQLAEAQKKAEELQRFQKDYHTAESQLAVLQQQVEQLTHERETSTTSHRELLRGLQEEKARMETELTELQVFKQVNGARLLDVEKQLTTTVRERDTLAAEAKQHEGRAAEVEMQAAVLGHQLEEARVRLKELTDGAAEAQRQIAGLQEGVTKYQQEISVQTVRYEEQRDRFLQLTKDYDALLAQRTEEQRDTRQQLEQARLECKSLGDKLLAMQGETSAKSATLQADLGKLQDAHERLGEQHQEARQALAAAQAKLEETMRDRDETRERLVRERATAEELQRQVARLEATAGEYKDRSGVLQSQLEDERVAHGRASEELAQYKERHATAQEELRRAAERAAELSQANRDLELQLTISGRGRENEEVQRQAEKQARLQAEQDLRQAVEQRAAAEQEGLRSRLLLQAAEERAAKAEQELLAARQEQERLQAERVGHAVAASQLTGLQELKEMLKQENEQLKRRVEEKQEACGKLVSDLSRAEERARELSDELADVQKGAHRSEKEIDSLRDSLVLRQQEVREQERKVADLTAQLAQRTRELQAAQGSSSRDQDFQAQLSLKDVQLEDYRRKADQLQVKLAQKEDQVKDFRLKYTTAAQQKEALQKQVEMQAAQLAEFQYRTAARTAYTPRAGLGGAGTQTALPPFANPAPSLPRPAPDADSQ